MQKRGWTQTTFAAKTSTRQPTISAFLRGVRGVSLATAEAWERTLGGEVTAWELIKHVPPNRPDRTKRRPSKPRAA